MQLPEGSRCYRLEPTACADGNALLRRTLCRYQISLLQNHWSFEISFQNFRLWSYFLYSKFVSILKQTHQVSINLRLFSEFNTKILVRLSNWFKPSYWQKRRNYLKIKFRGTDWRNTSYVGQTHAQCIRMESQFWQWKYMAAGVKLALHQILDLLLCYPLGLERY